VFGKYTHSLKAGMVRPEAQVYPGWVGLEDGPTTLFKKTKWASPAIRAGLAPAHTRGD